jgi:hypothetical protein
MYCNGRGWFRSINNFCFIFFYNFEETFLRHSFNSNISRIILCAFQDLLLNPSVSYFTYLFVNQYSIHYPANKISFRQNVNNNSLLKRNYLLLVTSFICKFYLYQNTDVLNKCVQSLHLNNSSNGAASLRI